MIEIATVLQATVGLIFAWSSLWKLASPNEFASVVVAYLIVPLKFVTIVTRVLPAVELVSGAAIIAGAGVQAGVVILALLATVFGLAIALTLARGRNIECGCFGPRGQMVSWATFSRACAIGIATWLALVSAFSGENGYPMGPERLWIAMATSAAMVVSVLFWKGAPVARFVLTRKGGLP